MSKALNLRPARIAAGIAAFITAAITVISAVVLDAVPAFAHVPPPDAAAPGRLTPVTTGSHSSSGAALWTYILVAAIALAVGIAVSYGASRLRSTVRSTQRPAVQTA